MYTLLPSRDDDQRWRRKTTVLVQGKTRRGKLERGSSKEKLERKRRNKNSIREKIKLQVLKHLMKCETSGKLREKFFASPS
jgi:hypothetical protein